MVHIALRLLFVQIVAQWQGDFSSNTALQSFRSKYLLVPDWRAHVAASKEQVEAVMNHEQVVAGPKKWIVIDKHMVDPSGLTCNKIGSGAQAMVTQSVRCRQQRGS